MRFAARRVAHCRRHLLSTCNLALESGVSAHTPCDLVGYKTAIHADRYVRRIHHDSGQSPVPVFEWVNLRHQEVQENRELAGRELVKICMGEADPLRRRQQRRDAVTVAQGIETFFEEFCPNRIQNRRMAARTVRDYKRWRPATSSPPSASWTSTRYSAPTSKPW